MADEKSGKGFTVVDRRVAEEEGKAAPAKKNESKAEKPATDKKPAETKAAAESVVQPPAAEDCVTPEQAGEDYKEAAAKDGKSAAMPPMNFPTFLLSLHASALLHMGVLEDPSIGKEVVSHELARQNITLLEIIQEKTKGNLTGEEGKLLDNILYELRMAYLQVTGAVGQKEC